MERLTERTKYGIVGNNNGVENFPLYSLYDETHLDHGLIEQCFNKLAEYEDLEEQGLLLRLPCKVGDTVYSCECGMIVRDFVHSFSTDANGLWVLNLYGGIIGLFGLSVFTTQEEAEAALAKMEEV